MYKNLHKSANIKETKNNNVQPQTARYTNIRMHISVLLYFLEPKRNQHRRKRMHTGRILITDYATFWVCSGK